MPILAGFSGRIAQILSIKKKFEDFQCPIWIENMFSSIRSINRTKSRPIWTRICEDIAIMKKKPDVDQHFKSDQGMSQLSLVIFIVSGTHRKPQKSFIL